MLTAGRLCERLKFFGWLRLIPPPGEKQPLTKFKCAVLGGFPACAWGLAQNCSFFKGACSPPLSPAGFGGSCGSGPSLQGSDPQQQAQAWLLVRGQHGGCGAVEPGKGGFTLPPDLFLAPSSPGLAPDPCHTSVAIPLPHHPGAATQARRTGPLPASAS